MTETDRHTPPSLTPLRAHHPTDGDTRITIWTVGSGDSGDEDTLHPEDAIAPPPPTAAAPGDTMVVAAADIDAAVAAHAPSATPQAGIGRRLLALAVIAVLVTVIVVLVWLGLAR